MALTGAFGLRASRSLSVTSRECDDGAVTATFDSSTAGSRPAQPASHIAGTLDFDGQVDLVSDAVAEEDPQQGLVPAKNSSAASTKVSEIATALGMLRPTLPEAMSHQPTELVGVSDGAWRQLLGLYDAGGHSKLFAKAFANGRVFARSDRGLRQRHPNTVEWSGPFQARWTSAIPADLRVDDVYLVSCKYDSKILHNTSPARFFESRLTESLRSTGPWFDSIALEQYQVYFAAVRSHYGLTGVSADVTKLDAADRSILKQALPRQLPDELSAEQAAFCHAMATASVERWRKSVTSLRQRQEFALSLLRIPQAIYFLLGVDGPTSLRFKVASRWDWAKQYEVRELKMSGRDGAMQPTVDWRLVVTDTAVHTDVVVDGHVEVRWSHGRFLGAPEAKVKLDTPLCAVPGYLALDD